MTLLIDRSGRPAPVLDADLRAWASGQVIFISSEMAGLRDQRRALAERLRGLGFEVILFEDLGGRDDDAEVAYLDGVARSGLYLGLVADRYGTMLPSGRSPTHEEYRKARELGLSVAVWVAEDGSARQGDARDFVAEVQRFHTTGTWSSTPALVESVENRMRELAAEAASPWMKLDDVVARAQTIEEDGRQLVVTLSSRDERVLAALQALRPDGLGRGGDVAITLPYASGRARVREVRSSMAAGAARQLHISADITWADGRRPSLASGINGISYDEQVEAGLRCGLLGEALPGQLGILSGMVDATDPLAELDALALAQAVYAPVARLLIVERLLGAGGASSVQTASVGPEHAGRRTLRVQWTEALWASNVVPEQRELEGVRCSA